MAFTFSKLATVAVGSGGSSTIEFTNIPQNYKDLCVKLSLRSDRSGVQSTGFNLYAFNNDTGSTLSRKWILGESLTPSSAAGTAASIMQIASIPAATATANTFANIEINIPNYNSSKLKSINIDTVSEDNSSTGYLLFHTATLWNNISPITSMKFYANSGNLVQYSTATLYGIRAEV
jgi:hypothetical protein